MGDPPAPQSLSASQDLRIIPAATGFFGDDTSISYSKRSYFSPDGVHWDPVVLPERYRQALPLLVDGTWY